MNLTKLARPFYKISENDLVIIKPITQEILNLNDFKDTILDDRLSDSCGYIKLKSGMILYNYYNAKVKNKNLQQFNIEPKSMVKKAETFTIEKDEHLRIPKGINKIFTLENGMKVLTKIQKAYNNILIENCTLRNKDENITYQNLYTNLLVEFNGLLSGKSSLFDRALNSNWPFSLRATISNGPNLKINEICLPYKVLLKWISKPELREAYNIDKNLANYDAVRCLEGKRVIALRQPVHDRSNMMSFKIKIGYNNS